MFQWSAKLNNFFCPGRSPVIWKWGFHPVFSFPLVLTSSGLLARLLQDQHFAQLMEFLVARLQQVPAGAGVSDAGVEGDAHGVFHNSHTPTHTGHTPGHTRTHT